MGMSDRRRILRAKKKATKDARMRGPKNRTTSKYALKLRGIYPPGSPYVTGNWGKRMKKLRDNPTPQPLGLSSYRPSRYLLAERYLEGALP